MAMTFLKKAKAFLPTQSVKYLLHSHLNGPDPARPMSRLKEFRAGKVGMPFGICATALVPRAMKCPLRAACFSGEHPPVHDWAAKD